MALQVNLTDPVCRLGSRRARTGQPATRHLHHFAGVYHTEHGKLLSGCAGKWTGERGRPWTTSRCPQEVAEGASEAESGKAGHTGPMPPGEGPSPWECGRMRELHAHAPADEAKKRSSATLA